MSQSKFSGTRKLTLRYQYFGMKFDFEILQVEHSLKYCLLFAVHFPTITKFLYNTFNWSVFYPVDSLKFFTEVIRELIEDRKKNEDVSRLI